VIIREGKLAVWGANILLRWEWFVKKVAFEPGVKSVWVMDAESGNDVKDDSEEVNNTTDKADEMAIAQKRNMIQSFSVWLILFWSVRLCAVSNSAIIKENLYSPYNGSNVKWEI